MVVTIALVNLSMSLLDECDLPNVINCFLAKTSDGVTGLNPDIIAELRSNFIDDYDKFIISEFDVYKVLSRLKVGKASLYDTIDNRLLRELADVLAAPICAVINSSFRQGIIPDQWMISRVTPIPKIIPVRTIENDIRPISITCPISRVAEVFTAEIFDECFCQLLDDDQFGSTAGRSTTLALIKISHVIFDAADDCRNIIRVLFVDFKKAFDCIDHTILSDKFARCDFSPRISAWMLSFLSNRKQYVNVGNAISDIYVTNVGAPQGTRAGPNSFKLLINDLRLEKSCVKYVDDLSIATVSNSIDDNDMQKIANKIEEWSCSNKMTVNTSKTKEMVIYFGKKYMKADIPVTRINSNVIERVDQFKLLGLVFSADLSWGPHVEYIVAKASRRLFAICQMIRSRIPVADIIEVYCSVIRSIVEYASPVWHCGLTQAQSDEIENIQKRCLRIIFPELSYSDARQIAGLDLLSVRRFNAVKKLFQEIKCDNHVLNKLIPRNEIVNVNYSLRDRYPYQLPVMRTGRPMKSFFNYCVRKKL